MSSCHSSSSVVDKLLHYYNRQEPPTKGNLYLLESLYYNTVFLPRGLSVSYDSGLALYKGHVHQPNGVRRRPTDFGSHQSRKLITVEFAVESNYTAVNSSDYVFCMGDLSRSNVRPSNCSASMWLPPSMQV